MSVRKVVNRNSVSWHYYFRIRGRRYRSVIPEAKNRSQALIAETRIRNDIFDGKFGIKQQTETVKGFCSKVFLPWAEQNRRSWPKEASRIKPILEFFGSKRLADVSPFDIERFKTKRRSTPIVLNPDSKPISRSRSIASVNRELSLLSRIFSLAILKEELTANPCQKVKAISGEQPRTRYLLPEEEANLMPALERDSRQHLRVIVLLALNTGMRRGEILRLRWEQVDFHKSEIKATHTKTSRDRFIPMNQQVQGALQRLRDISDSDWLFPSRDGQSLKGVATAFRGACREAGIENFRFHDLRHTFGTRAADAGASLTAIAAVMGHADIHTTMRYAHATDQGRRRVVESVAGQIRTDLANHWPSKTGTMDRS